MSAGDIREALRRAALFQELGSELLGRVVETCRERRFSAGDGIFSQGEPCRGFFVIRSGAVRLYRLSQDGHEQVVHSLSPGQSFAEAALFSIGRYPVHGEATVSPTELIEVQGGPFLALFHGEPALSASIVGSLSKRLLHLVERVEELSIVSADARLARHLLRLPARAGDGPLTVRLPSTKKELAGLLAMTPETLSRILRRWRDRGILGGEGGALALLDVEAFEAIVRG